MKRDRIDIRMYRDVKLQWLREAKKRGIDLSKLIILAVTQYLEKTSPETP